MSSSAGAKRANPYRPYPTVLNICAAAPFPLPIRHFRQGTTHQHLTPHMARPTCPTHSMHETISPCDTVGFSLTLISTLSIKVNERPPNCVATPITTYTTFILCSPRAPTHIEQLNGPFYNLAPS